MRIRSVILRLLRLSLRRHSAADEIADEVTKSAIAEHNLQFPVEFYNLIYEQIVPMTNHVIPLKSSDDISQRLANLFATLRYGMHPVPLGVAVEIALYADHLRGNWQSPAKMYRSYDVGEHFIVSSSLGAKGRLLMNIVRYCASRACLEIGTGYGVSAFYLMEAQKRCGLAPLLTTIEGFSPQKEISAKFLNTKYGSAATLLHGTKSDCLNNIISNPDQFDLLFHDGGHSGDAYLEEILALLPTLRDGAIVVIDDIRWKDRGNRSSKRTCHEAWLEIVNDRRVKNAVEADSTIGILQLG
jgi:predicted O-methyltransferase YrrM